MANFWPWHSKQQAAPQGEPNKSLLEEVREYDKDAAEVLKRADLCSNADLQSLTQQDLHELFPEVKNFKLRRKIFQTIKKRKSINDVLKEMKELVPHEYLKSSLTASGVLVDYLHILKDLKTQMDCVQTFINAHIDILENIKQTPPGPSDLSCRAELSKTGSVSKKTTSLPTTPQQEVKYKMLVSGKTFDAHLQLMQHVKREPHLDVILLTENDEHFQVTIVFCPIISRAGSDIEVAMAEVQDKKPVILVVMHHEREARNEMNARYMEKHAENVLIMVNVFFHETMHGLVKCKENDDAAYQIRQQLLKIQLSEKKHYP
ncbi:uncharacterized protein LOC115038318 isoform X1 [Echeneis naucrates]|uniref:uncharacterized protein LOC115038318 isoform X1 n=1 Tax=Echeneis naucrates TaxID=173247 RepID=UPI001113D87C|nr:uncharacterized protein LOC115038318 isoform X1 [Echeneis naucrates]XP_029353060.1 uncharacterized protein LOC115038318 isoform X1 [Echeneis naucrates]